MDFSIFFLLPGTCQKATYLSQMQIVQTISNDNEAFVFRSSKEQRFLEVNFLHILYCSTSEKSWGANIVTRGSKRLFWSRVLDSLRPERTTMTRVDTRVNMAATHGQGGGWWGDTPMHVVKPYVVTYAVFRLYHPPSRSKNDRCSPMCDGCLCLTSDIGRAKGNVVLAHGLSKENDLSNLFLVYIMHPRVGVICII